MENDPIVAEIRKNRFEIEKEWGETFENISRNALKYQEQFKNRLITLEEIERNRLETGSLTSANSG